MPYIMCSIVVYTLTHVHLIHLYIYCSCCI